MNASTSATVAHFTIAYWCVLVAALLPYVCASLAKSGGAGKSRKAGGFDNHDPRAWLAQQTSWHARANAAQANSFEGLPFFIGAVVIAHQLGAPQMWVDALAMVYVVSRLAFIYCYVRDLPTARSGVWTLGLLANVAILLAGLRW